MSEKTIVNKALKYLNDLDGCWAEKIHGGIYQTAGIPDIIGCYKGSSNNWIGIFFAIEMKIHGKKATDLQVAMIKQIQKAGGAAIVACTLEEVKKLIEILDERIGEMKCNK